MALWQKAIMLAQADQQSPTPSIMVRNTARLAYLWLRDAAMALEDYAGGRAYILRALAIPRRWAMYGPS